MLGKFSPTMLARAMSATTMTGAPSSIMSTTTGAHTSSSNSTFSLSARPLATSSLASHDDDVAMGPYSPVNPLSSVVSSFLLPMSSEYTSFYNAELGHAEMRTWLRMNGCMQYQQQGSGTKKKGLSAAAATTTQSPVVVTHHGTCAVAEGGCHTVMINHSAHNNCTATAITNGSAMTATSPTLDRTHLLMDGGVAIVRDDQMSGFLGSYALSVMNKDPISVSEQRSPVFRMHWDFDIFEPSAPILQDELVEFVHVLQHDIGRFYSAHYDDASLQTLLLTCVMIRDPVQERNGWSTGMHVVMPNVWVRPEQALQMRVSNIVALQSAFMEVYPQWNWNKVVDEAIYISNGLRMPHSHKYEECPNCRNVDEKKINCANCNAHGKVSVGRIYKPVAVLLGDGALQTYLTMRITSNPATCLQYCIIRCPLDACETPHWEPYVGCPQYVPPPEKPTRRRNTQQQQTTTFDSDFVDMSAFAPSALLSVNPADLGMPEFAEDRKAFNSQMKKKTPIDRDSLQWRCIEQLARRSFPHAPYQDIYIKDIYTNTQQTYYVARTAGAGSSYCMNIDGDHRHNTIYFYITDRGICQRCWCRCDTLAGRKFGFCRDYKSNVSPMTTNEKQILFGASVGLLSSSGANKKRSTGVDFMATVGPNTEQNMVSRLENMAQEFRLRRMELEKQMQKADNGKAPARKRVKL